MRALSARRAGNRPSGGEDVERVRQGRNSPRRAMSIGSVAGAGRVARVGGRRAGKVMAGGIGRERMFAPPRFVSFAEITDADASLAIIRVSRVSRHPVTQGKVVCMCSTTTC